MNVQEIPVSFACQGNALIGIVHVPESPRPRGVLAIVAGGPQYRGGCCRQLVQMARSLSAEGFAVMRFDYRGLGDSAGDYKGFLDIAPDLNAAIDVLLAKAPEVEEVILWGGCDASSAALIHGPKHPKVKGLILGNPFVHNEATHAKVIVKHYYLQRLKDKSFWKKLISFRLNPMKALGSAIATAQKAKRETDLNMGQSAATGNAPFPLLMLEGAKQFKGRVLLQMSGRSLVSKEFDELVTASADWQKALNHLNLIRVDFPDADQAFSTIAARAEQISSAIKWLKTA
jgi:exosortase A-associated hydrolase 1